MFLLEKLKTICAIALLALTCAPSAWAKVVLPRIMSDHMILQRNTKTCIWGWADPGELVTVEFAGQVKKAVPNEKGCWQVTLDPLETSSTGQDMTVKGTNTIVLKDVLVGEVWLAAGQSNMVSGLKQVPADEKKVFLAQKSNTQVRVFLVGGKKPEPHPGDVNGAWFRCSDQALHTSAVGFFFAFRLQQELKVPVAYIVAAQCGSKIEPFIPEDACKTAGLVSEGKRKYSGTYSSQIAPLTSYSIRGAIWYQGESNRGSTNYYTCVKALSAGWSKAFRLPNIPFYQVQVAPFDYSRKGVRSSLLADTVWAAQYRAAKEIPGVGIVAIHDTDINIKKIHPRRKKPVGERLAALALKHQYGKDVIVTGPVFAGATIKGANVLVSFNDIDQGLTTKDGKPPTCFELSEDGKTFVGATAGINGNQVEVHSTKLTSPKFIRMGWYDTATPNLRDKNGWPAFIFPAKEIK